MQSEDRVIDLLRAYVKEEAPADLWQVVSADIANVLRKIVAVSAECQRAKLELHELKKHVKCLEENSSLSSQMRTDIIYRVPDAGEIVDDKETAVLPRQADGVFLAPGGTATLPGVMKRRYLHWCKVCNELARSSVANPATCPRRGCRSALWRKGESGAGRSSEATVRAKTRHRRERAGQAP